MKRFRLALFLFVFLIFTIAETSFSELHNAVSEQITPSDTTFMVELDFTDRQSAGDGEYDGLSRNIAFIPDCAFSSDDQTCHVTVSDHILHVVNDGEVESSQYVTIESMREEDHLILLSAGHTYTFSMSIDHLVSTENGGSYIWKALPAGGEKSKTITDELYFTNSASTVRYFSYTPDEDVYVWLQIKFSPNKHNDFYLKIQIEEGSVYSAWTEPVDPALVSTRIVGYIDEEAYRLIKINRNEIALRSVNPLYGKTIVTFGDSIAHGSGEGNEGGASRIIAIANAMTSYNCAKGGATFHTNKENNILAQIEAEHASHPERKPDYVLFNGYTNDILDLDSGALQMGEISNEAITADSPSDYEYTFDSTTFTGAVELTAYTLRKYYPESVIIYFSPHRMVSRTWETQLAAHDRVIEVMSKWSIPVVDLFNEGLNTYLPEMRRLYTSDTYSTGLGDGTHPNVLGYRMFYAPLIADKMRALSPIMEETVMFVAGSAVEEISSDVECLGVSLDQASLTFSDMNAQKLTVSLIPANTTNKLTWTSSDSAVAAVKGSGNSAAVTPRSNGTATITAQCGNYHAACVVTVDAAAAEGSPEETGSEAAAVQEESPAVDSTEETAADPAEALPENAEDTAEALPENAEEQTEGILEISELCASNKTAYQTPDGDAPDWIELHNTGGTPLALDGWYLSNDEDEPFLFSLSGDALQPGEYRVLRADRKELPFKLSASGGTLLLTKEETQAVAFPSLSSDRSYSLQPDGAWHVTAATPGEANAAGEPYVEPPFVVAPKFSENAGFFDEPFELTLSGYGDVRIYYTTDGSIPDEASTLYTAPISIYNRSSDANVWSAREDVMLVKKECPPPDYLVDKCNIIRAVAIDEAGNKSAVVTNTYFVGLTYENIYVLSIVAEPDALFDKDDGIYVLGKIYYDWLENSQNNHNVSNFYKPTNFGKSNPLSSREREIAANLQLFNLDGAVDFQQTLALRIQGNQTRNFPQKSFRVTARNEITGTNKIDFKLRDDLPKMKSLCISADTNGNYGDWNGFPSADVFAHMLASEQGLVHSYATPCIVFLEGEYWGVYNLTPVMNEKYIEAVTGVDADDMIVIKNNEYAQGAEAYADTFADWNAFLAHLQTMDFSTAENYEYTCSLIDMENYCRYLAVNLYLESYDTVGRTYNMTVWRTIESNGAGYHDGRWRWTFQDMDLSCVFGHDCVETLLPSETVFQLMWHNQDFQALFKSILTEFINVDCSEINIQKLVDQYTQMYGPHIYDTQRRFSSPKIVTTEKNAAQLLAFFNTSREEFLTRFSSQMKADEEIRRLTVNLSDGAAPSLRVNGRDAVYHQGIWTGQYFENQTVSLAVCDVPAYDFLGWYEGDTLLTEEKELTLTVSGDVTVQPRYQAMGRLLEVNETKQALMNEDGTAVIPSNVRQVAGTAAADEGLTLTAHETLILSSDKKWAADTGVTLAWNPEGSHSMRLFALASVSGDAPSRWKVQYSTDGETWNDIADFRASEKDGSVQLDIPFPDALNEAEKARVRIVSEKKGSAGALTLAQVVLCGEMEGDLTLSEFCPSNKNAYTTETGDAPDWIELHNTGTTPLSLDGWYLSNDTDEPYMFSLAGRTLQGQEYLILQADGEELPFKLSASGTQVVLTGEDRQETVSVPPLSKDQTYSLQPDGAWHMTAATPGESNAAGEPYVEPPFVAPPKFSHTAGFYDDPFELTLSGYGDVKIYYTTDCSDPDENATLYDGPISIYNRTDEPNVWSAREDIALSEKAVPAPSFNVDKCTVVRAVAIDQDGNKSKIVTNTYFNGLEYENIYVLSIVSDPYLIFDRNDGIYVLGKIYYDWLKDPTQKHDVIDFDKPTNYGKTNPLSSREREVPALLQLFDASQKLRLDQTLAIRINGNYSRGQPQKSFKVIARTEVSGTSKIGVRLWEALPSMKELGVRADGNTTAYPSLDVLAHMLVSDQGLVYSRATPCLVFLEGEYWGLYNLRPVMDEKYISASVNIPVEELIVNKNNEFIAGQYTDYKSWNAFLRTFSALDYTQPESYERLCSVLDIDNYIRYTAANLYLENIDFGDGYNMTIWRSQETGGEGYRDGKWRYSFQDMDRSCDLSNDAVLFTTTLTEKMPLFQALWKSDVFREKFMQVLLEFMNVDCSAGRIDQCVNQYAEMYSHYLLDTQLRFNGGTLLSAEKMVKKLNAFFQNTRNTFLDNFCKAMGYEKPHYRLTVDLSTVSKTVLTVNGLESLYLNKEWVGQYFDGAAVTLRVDDVPTYGFLGWYEGDTLLTEDHTLSLTLTEDRTIAPRYSAYPRLVDSTTKTKLVLSRNQATLPSNDYQIKALLIADDSLTLEGDHALTLTSEDKWTADTGFTLQWNTNKYANQTLFTAVSITDRVPAKWTAYWSTDGSEWVKLAQLKAKEDETAQWEISLPSELDDVNAVYLRFTSDKKADGGSLTLDSLVLCAELQQNSLANIKEYAARCQAIAGDSFIAPDLEALMQLSKVQISDEEVVWCNKLTQLLLAQNTSTVAQALPDVKYLTYYGGNPAYTVTKEIASLSKKEWVIAGIVPDGTAYMCRFEDGQLTSQTECQVVDGRVQLDLEAGVYALLEKQPDQIGIHARVRVSELSQEFVDWALGGIRPLDSYQMEVSVARPDLTAIHMDSMPDGMAYGELYVYFITQDGALELTGVAAVNSDGSCDIPCSGVGNYLILRESLEDHLDYAEMISTRRQQGY